MVGGTARRLERDAGQGSETNRVVGLLTHYRRTAFHRTLTWIQAALKRMTDYFPRAGDLFSRNTVENPSEPDTWRLIR